MAHEFKAREYANKFTLDGRLHPQTGVNPKKVKEAQKLIKAARAGDRLADARLTEAVVSTDAVVNVAHALNLEFIPQYDREVHELGNVAGTRIVKDFRPTVLYSIYVGEGADTSEDDEYNKSRMRGNVLGEHGEAPVIPEGAPFPEVSISGGLESYYQKLRKRGLRFGWSLEAQINDTVGFFDQIPGELMAVTVDGKYAEFYDALTSVTSAQEVTAVTQVDGTKVPAKASLSPQAVIAAINQRAKRTVQGNKLGKASAYNLFVPIGTEDDWNFLMQRRVLQVDNGAFVESGSRYNTSLNNVTLIESERVADGSWYLVPKPNTTRRPVIEFLKLRGYETPELRVQNLTGSYVGGGAISPFEGSFDSDSLAYRLRDINGAVLWNADQIVWSDGTGGDITLPTFN